MRKLFILALALMAAEVWSLAFIGAKIGAIPALLLVIAGAILGVNLIRKSGANLSLLARGRVLDPKIVSSATADGLAFALAGLLFMSPGFFSDLGALAALLPWPRRMLGQWLEKHVVTIRPQAGGGPATGPVIEGEAIEVREAVDP